MVYIKFDQHKEGDVLEMRVSGHAGAGPAGYDLVCAGISAIATGIAQCIEIMGDDGKMVKKPRIEVRPGYVRIVAKPKPKHYAEALHTLYVGEISFTLFAKVYPQFVELKPFDLPVYGISE